MELLKNSSESISNNNKIDNDSFKSVKTDDLNDSMINLVDIKMPDIFNNCAKKVDPNDIKQRIEMRFRKAK